MPRKSAESRAVAAIIASKRPPPPASLRPDAAKLWRSILAEHPLGYFDAGNLPLLQSYCACLNILANLDIGSATHKRLLMCVVTLATKLRLTVQSNTHRRAGILDERANPSPFLGGNVTSLLGPKK